MSTKMENLAKNAKSDDWSIRKEVAKASGCSMSTLELLSHDEEVEVRLAVAKNKETPQEMLKNMMLNDPDASVQDMAYNHLKSINYQRDWIMEACEEELFKNFVYLDDDTQKKLADKEICRAYLRQSFTNLSDEKVDAIVERVTPLMEDLINGDKSSIKPLITEMAQAVHEDEQEIPLDDIKGYMNKAEAPKQEEPKKGLIRVTNIRNVSEGEYDKTIAIVRSLKSPSPWMEQCSALSPSDDLFHWYLREKEAGRWNEEAFTKTYVPRFLNELIDSKEATDALNALYKLQKHGEQVAIMCFCPNEELCHRTIVAGLLQGVGANVETDKKQDYTKYYQQYLDIKKERKAQKAKDKEEPKEEPSKEEDDRDDR